ncbi:PaaI family thioesterase [Polyangium jinanense]|uniref:PaaI family thioesterase n=1 Tax=Polyangium jinanense TaxID=2829994 RepID=A0A9X4ATE0_9BACT|nr:PaaI family thioesterase [Polyangium jinanense]MDC3961273.1 PaaI family thioesterase [Polyangium jinanense]MDC3984094.1 PaaI family thioesterase [Polyangium jinanense]
MTTTEETPWMKKMRAILKGAEPPPIAKLIGFELVDVGAGSAVFTLVGDPSKHANPMGTMHGGVLVDLGDAAMGFAMASTLAEGESFTTVELKANYFKPVWKSRLRAEARMVKRSRSLGYIECDIVDEEKALVCRLASTCMVLRGEAAQGR